MRTKVRSSILQNPNLGSPHEQRCRHVSKFHCEVTKCSSAYNAGICARATLAPNSRIDDAEYFMVVYLDDANN